MFNYNTEEINLFCFLPNLYFLEETKSEIETWYWTVIRDSLWLSGVANVLFFTRFGESGFVSSQIRRFSFFSEYI